MCVQVLPFVCMGSISKELLWEKLCAEIGFIAKCVADKWKDVRFTEFTAVFTVIDTQWMQHTIDQKMSFSCFNRYSNLFWWFLNPRIAWVIFNQTLTGIILLSNKFYIFMGTLLIHAPFSPCWAIPLSSVWSTKYLGSPSSTSRVVYAAAPVGWSPRSILCDCLEWKTDVFQALGLQTSEMSKWS